MANSPLNTLSLTREPWSRLAALYRRACVLRALGHEPAAERCYTLQFLPAVEEARSRLGNEIVSAENLDSLRALEQDRVNSAAIIAELMRPLLDVTVAPAPADRPSPPPEFSRRDTAGCPPAAIADMLDDMLAQQKHRRLR